MRMHTYFLLATLALLFSTASASSLLSCARNYTELHEHHVVASTGSSFLQNLIVDYRILHDSRLLYIENQRNYATSQSKLKLMPNLNHPHQLKTLINSDANVDGRLCGMSDADYNGNVYVVTFLKDINQVVSPLKLTQVITDQSAVGRTVEYTEPSVTDIPVYNVDGTVSGVMNGDDANVVSATGGCMSVVVNPARLDTGALLVKSYKGSVVVVHYDLKDMKKLRHTVLLPQVNDVEVDHETAGKLRVDANHGFIYAFVAMTKEVQVAVETMHNLAHNSVIQFPEHAGSNTTVHVLFKIDSGSGVILGIKQISVYESMTTEHLIDMDIYADPKTFTTTMHAIGTVPMDKSNKFLYLRYDGIEKMESTVRLDPDFFSVFNFSGNIAPIPKNIVAKDDSTAVISGGSSPAIFHHSNAFLREYDSKAGQSYGIAWSAKSDLFANAMQIVDGKIYYVQQRGDPNALTTSLDVKWCGPYNPNPPNPPPKKPLNYRKLIVGLSLGLSVPFISIIALAVCAVALFKVMRKGDDIERTRLM